MNLDYVIRTEIKDKISYLYLCGLLTPSNDGGVLNNRNVSFFDSVNDFVKHANSERIILEGPSILNQIEPLFVTTKKLYPPRIDINTISKRFNEYIKNNPEYIRYGIDFGWLNSLLDCKAIYHGFLPYHTKVGLAIHARMFSIEESVLLRDAFYFIVLGEKQIERLENLRKQGARSYSNKQDFYNKGSSINMNVGTFSRTCLLNAYSFVETYINSIGYDYYMKNKNELAPSIAELLLGKKNGRYLSLEKKMEVILSIINHGSTINLSDKNQIHEPYKFFFDECKEVRDASVHYSPIKAAIIRQPFEWIEKAQKYLFASLEVAKDYWKKCYPNQGYPDYLDLLDYQILKEIALKRYNVDKG